MKNLIYIICILVNLGGSVILAQESDTVKSPVQEVSSKETPDEMKAKFGSKEHRSLIQGVPGNVESTENILLKTCLSLAAVLAIILIIFSILKKVNKRLSNVGTDNPLRVQNKMVLDSKNYLALIRVYEEELLVSIGPNGSTLLAKYALVDKDEAEGTDFENILNSQGKSVIPIDPENVINSFDLKSIKELKDGKS